MRNLLILLASKDPTYDYDLQQVEDDFRTMAELMRDVVVGSTIVIDNVRALRKRFHTLQFCFGGDAYAKHIQALHELL